MTNADYTPEEIERAARILGDKWPESAMFCRFAVDMVINGQGEAFEDAALKDIKEALRRAREEK